MNRRPILRAAALAGLCGAVLATRVFVAFEPIRIKLVDAPLIARDGAVRLSSTDEGLDALEPPFAVIARIHHGGAEDHTFSIRIDDREVCRPVVTGGQGRRIDCVLSSDWERLTAHQVLVEGPAPWTLEYLEIATHHGSSRGVIAAFVVPAQSQRYTQPSLIWVVAVMVIVAGSILVPNAVPVSRALLAVQRSIDVLVVVLFVLILVAPAVSRYRVVLSSWTFAGWASLLLLSRAAFVVGALWRSERSYRRLAGALASSVCAFGLLCGSRALGAADTYGYVSQAELWLQGSLKIDQSFAQSAPWPQPAWTFAPLGYRPHPLDDRLIVPIYAPGLPMLLAAAKLAGGQDAMFVVIPVCGGALVFATFALGRRLGSAAAGLIAAWLLATSPVVLGHLTTVTTDVPVAAAWAGAFYLLLGKGARDALGAGLLSSAAVLIRPNLAPLVAILALHYVIKLFDASVRRSAGRDLLIFSLAALPSVAAVAAINTYLFGSPLSSGYGHLSDVFQWSRVSPNIRNYLDGLVDAHTPIVLVGFGAIFAPLRLLWPGAPDRRGFVIVGLFVLALWLNYCAWLVFDSWWFTRFLLSSLPFAMLGIGAVAVAVAQAPAPVIKQLVVCAVIGLGIVQLRFAERSGVFDVPQLERRNVVIAQLTQQVTAANGVVLSGIHSGSVRYYAGRMTLNYTQLDEAWLDKAVAWLHDRSAHPYVLLEEWEEAEFRRRFAGSRSLTMLDGTAAGIYEGPARATIFDLSPGPQLVSKPVVAAGTGSGWRAVPPAAPPRLMLVESAAVRPQP